MPKFMIIDGNAIVHRGYHAIPPLTTKDGLMVNAVYGFTSMLLKAFNDLKPEYVAVTFDVGGGTFRHERYAKYKATRVKADQELYDQIPLVHEIVSAFNIPIYEKKGYEADDVIGTIIKQQREKIENQGIDIYIVTGDMDTLQLIYDGRVKVYTLRKGLSDIVIYDSKAVKERFGFGPELMIDYKALRGDASDNIPGVPGVGEKTATELIQKIGGIDEVYKQLANSKEQIARMIKPGVINKLEAGKESAYLSKELATINCEVPDINLKFEDCEIKPFDKEKVMELFQKFEFVSLLKRVPGFLEVKPTDAKTISGRKKEPMPEFSWQEIKTNSELEKLISLIKTKKQFAARVLTNSPDFFSASITGLIVVAEYKGFSISKELIKNFLPLFEDPAIEIIGHDLKQTIKILKVQGTEVANKLFDVMVASYLLNPGSRAHDLVSIFLKILGKEAPLASGQAGLFGLDEKAVAHELFLLMKAGEQLKKELSLADNLGLLDNVEMPLSQVLANMELNGVAIDTEALKKLATKLQMEVKQLTERIYTLAGEEFNIGSPLQLREVLFEKMDIPKLGVKKGKTGLSTSADELEKLRGLHPIIDEISSYRELTKLLNTYIEVLPTLINKKTGRIHTTFNQAVAATGRLSSSDPNLQNIPIRTELGREIRNAFIAEAGNLLISADYSQIELRIVASLAEDAKMIEIFNKDEDIHRATAAAIKGIPADQVTKEMRRAAKEVNFGVLYGMGPHGLSSRTGIPYAQAQEFISKYFEQFSGVKEYIDRTLAFTKKEGYCETLFGRRRYIPELQSSNYQLRSSAERMAINHPVQGTAADVMKMAMIKIYEEIKKLRNPDFAVAQNRVPTEVEDPRSVAIGRSSIPANRNRDKARLILQVHDELVLEVKKELAEEISEMVKEVMENIVKLRVPVKVETAIGERWEK